MTMTCSNSPWCRAAILLLLIVFISSSRTAWGGNTEHSHELIPTTTLADGSTFPLVGLGVGNLQHSLIVEAIELAMASDKQTRVFDTAHASNNEDLVKTGIVNGLAAYKTRGRSGTNKDVHVITKVWYTHLGYERTKISVRESLQALNHPNIRVHVLIHWPRCRNDIPWMRCEQEENDLPQQVKDAGPPPHLNKDTAFLESWRALEDIYLGKVSLGNGLPKLASIGVSNFDLEDLKALEARDNHRVTPMILQSNIWYYVFDPKLMNYCHERKILFQAFNVVNGVFYDREWEDAPNAMEALNSISRQLTERSAYGGNTHKHAIDKASQDFSVPQIVFKWLIQNQVSVIPRTSSKVRLAENSALAIARMPLLDALEQDTVQAAVAALLTKEDLKPPLAEFFNQAENAILNIFWVHDVTGEEVPIKEQLHSGEIYTAYTKPQHKFVVYYEGTDVRKEFTVHAQHGQHQRFDLHEEDEL